MSRFRPSARALLLLALGCLPLPASAARWFEIELLVFAHETVDAGNELWPADPGRPDLLAARPLLPYDQPDEGAFGFRRLEPEQLQLTGAAERLRRSSRYRVLFHEAWRQPVGNRDDAPWVQVLAGDATTAALPQPPGGLAPETAPETAPAPLAGAVRLSVRRYLHLDVDLVRSDRLVAGAIPAATSSGVVAIPLGAAQETPAATGEA
ncbi:MAG TPA: CsiV family protein, partial [Gammaproteobacteria bacterium]